MTSIIGNSSFFAGFRSFKVHTRSANQSLEHLATGKQINRGSDNPAGLITSENLRSVLASLEGEARSLERTTQVANVADGVLGEVSSLLTEAEALTVANANTAGLSQEEIAANQMQIDSLVSTANRLTRGASFNGQPLFDGSLTLTANGASLTLDELSFGPVTTTGGSGAASEAQKSLAAARKNVTEMRGRIGAFSQNTVGTRSQSIYTTIANVFEANSHLIDTVFAHDIAELARSDGLRQASMAAMTAGLTSAASVLVLLS